MPKRFESGDQINRDARCAEGKHTVEELLVTRPDFKT
jgi:hypothetical protein